MIVRITSFAYTPGRSRPLTSMRRTFSGLERQALRGQHVADLRGADAEGDGAERAVRGRVAVAARDRHARLRQPELRADDVDDALLVAIGRLKTDAEVAAVAFERRGHFLGHDVEERALLRTRRHDVIDRGDRALGKRDGQPCCRSMSKACGLVTSCTRCSPMNNCV